MTLRYLQIFAKVCEHMSMSEAAKELYISQSAVSQAIRELENTYELSLFMRDRRQLRLTRAGEKLLVFARRIIELNNNIDQCMHETKIAPEMHLGVTDGLSEHYLPALLRHYRAECGQSPVVIHCGSRAQIENALISQELDLALFEGPLKSNSFQIYELFEDPIQVVCAKDSRLSPALTGDAPVLSMPELFALPQLCPDRSSAVYPTMVDMLRRSGIPLQQPSLFSSTASLCAAVGHDLGVGILSRVSIGDAPALKRVQVPELELTQPIRLIHHQKRFLFKQLQHFMDYILDYAQRQPPVVP